jgi:hypothetical protein
LFSGITDPHPSDGTRPPACKKARLLTDAGVLIRDLFDPAAARSFERGRLGRRSMGSVEFLNSEGTLERE